MLLFGQRHMIKWSLRLALFGEYACKSIWVYIIVVQLKLNFYHIIKCNFPTRNSLVIRIYSKLNRFWHAD